MKRAYHNSNQRPPQNIDHETVGQRMRDLRTARGLTMHDVAVLGGPSVNTQSLAESGLVSVHVKTLKSLADVLGVPVAKFLLGENSDIDAIVAVVYQMDNEQVATLLANLKRKVVN